MQEANGQNPFVGGSGTNADPYLIATPAQLARLAELVNADDANYVSKCYKLLNDLDLSDYGTNFNDGAGWIPIGEGFFFEGNRSFKGEFDGNNKKITGLYINVSNIGYVGLFGMIESAKIQNLSVEGVNIKSGWDYAAGIVGGAYDNSSLSNCTFSGTVSGGFYVGGIVGNLYGNMSNCYSNGAVSGFEFTGGVAGSVTGNMTNCYSTSVVNGSLFVGGVVGFVVNGNITNGYSINSVSGIGEVGGIVGRINGGSVTNCYSTGAVSASHDYNAGGIAGVVEHSGNITNCYSTGTVNSGGTAGGIAGTISIECSIINCYSAGAVSGNNYVGGIAGYIHFSMIINCAALSQNVKGNENVGRIGRNIFDDSTSFGNIAFCGMTTNGGSAFHGENTHNGFGGKNISAFELQTADGFPPAFTSSPWTYTAGRLPGLFGETVEKPDHLRTYTESMIVVLNNNGSVNVYPVSFVENEPDICDLTFLFVINGIDYPSLTYTCADVGTYNVSIVSIDKSGNRTQPQEVTFEIIEHPMPIIVFDVIQNREIDLDEFGSITIYPADFVENILYNCDLKFWFVKNGAEQESLFLSCADIGSQTLSIIAIDELGNRSQPMEVTFTIDDRIPPVFDVILELDVSLDVSNITIYPIDFVNNVYDNCSNEDDIILCFVINGIDHKSLTFSCTDIGIQSVFIVAIDELGNRSQLHDLIFTISDKTPPVFDVISDRHTLLDNNVINTIYPADFVTNVSDNCCSEDEITFLFVVNGDEQTSIDFTCNEIGIGSYVVTIIAIDKEGNYSIPKETTFTFCCQPPLDFDVIDGLDVALDNNGNVVVFPESFVTNISYSCGEIFLRFFVNESDHTSLTFTCNDIGTQIISVVTIDENGNRSQPKDVTLIISDQTPPIARCKQSTIYFDFNGNATLTTMMVDNGSTDICGIVLRQIKRTLDGDDRYDSSLDFYIDELDFSIDGNISVTLRVSDASGNESFCTSDVRLIEYVQMFDLGDIPVIFTPNGDGFNDTWEIPEIDKYPEAKIRIYNRTKKLMVELRGAQMPWDGRDRNGILLESGYYLYQIELRRGGKIISGYVNILR